MSTDGKEDDASAVSKPAPAAEEGFQKTEWSSASGSASAVPRTAIWNKQPSANTPTQMGSDISGHLPAGTRLGELEITSLIGEGGFGVVYLAQDHSLQRRVALKEYMPSQLAARSGGTQVFVKSERHRETFEAGLKSFINESRLLASFDHPSLVRVYRFWEANGTAYMVMPFLEGTTLKDVLRQMAQRPDEAWLRSVLGPLTEALLVIHAEQCYHRDIAPDNVMLLPQNKRWLLLDFGAARRVIGDMTQALTVILKPGYAPVEQYAEIPGMKQGPWTDVYALAAVVYFAIMGKTPPPSVGRLLNDTYVPLAQAAAGQYSDAFLAAIDRALAVRPEARTQTIGQLRTELGLGDVIAVDPYASVPLPPGSDVPARGSMQPVTTVPTRMLAPSFAAAAVGPQPVAAPPTAAPATPAPKPAPAPAPVPGPVPVQPPPVEAKSHSALAGVAIGVGVLAVLGFGAYKLGASPPAAPSPAPAVAAAATPAPSPAPPPAPAPPASTNFDVPQEFVRVVQAQTPGFGVQLQTNKTSYRIGKDNLSFTVQADRDGYLHAFIFGADGVLLQLYPNKTPIKVRKGQTLKLPQAPDTFQTTAPAGATDLLVMVSAQPRDHAALKPRMDGGILVFPHGRRSRATGGTGARAVARDGRTRQVPRRRHALRRRLRCSPGAAAGGAVNKAFVKEPEGLDGDDDDAAPGLPPLPPGVRNYITPAGYKRLREELMTLLDADRPKVVEAVSWAAKNGDRSENGDYIYGKKRLREIDRRIRFLSKRLDIAEVADPTVHHGRTQVFFGATVTYATAAGDERTVTIKGVDEAESLQGEVSWVSPIARALLKAHEGDEVALVTPGGVEKIEVLAVRYPAP